MISYYNYVMGATYRVYLWGLPNSLLQLCDGATYGGYLINYYNYVMGLPIDAS